VLTTNFGATISSCVRVGNEVPPDRAHQLGPFPLARLSGPVESASFVGTEIERIVMISRPPSWASLRHIDLNDHASRDSVPGWIP